MSGLAPPVFNYFSEMKNSAGIKRRSMKKAYIINLKYGIWENQLWLEADDNEAMQEKWEIAKAKLTDVATACQSSGDYFNKAIEHFQEYRSEPPMKEIKVTKNDSGQRIDRFLSKSFPLGQGQICKLARKNCIKLNGKKCKPDTHIAENDIIKLFIPDEMLIPKAKTDPDDFTSVSDKIDIVYEDENILLVDKPVGMVVHEDESGDSDTLINRIKSYLYRKGEYHPENELSFAPALCNRIDRNTCGIVIAAKNAESLRILNQKIRDRELTKLYLCIACGKVTPDSATLTAYLEKNSDTNTVKISDKKTKSNLTVKTKYKVIAYNGENSLLKVDLLTGRTHQIRAHLAYIGHALLGDGKYGNNKLNKKYGFKYQALCSYELQFKFTTDAGCLSYLDGKCFKAKAPDFVKMFGGNIKL